MPSPLLTKTTPILIVGAGTFGLSAAYHLVKAGYTSITVLEKSTTFPPALSAANDINKIIRAEYEDPFYTELALAALQEWTSNPVFAPHYHQTGYLLANSAAAQEKSRKTLAKSLESISRHPAWAGKIQVIENREDVRRAAPKLDGPMQGWKGYFNEKAGYAHSANALRSLYDYVVKNGVQVRLGKVVAELCYDGDRCTGIRTIDGGYIGAERVVLTLGASLGRVLPVVGRQMMAKAWPVAHVQLDSAEAERLAGIPVTYARDLGFFFEPEPGTGLLKLCPSGAGYTNYISDGISLPPDYNSFIPARDEKLLRQLLRETLPALAERPFVHKHICWCSDSADSDYVIDKVPGKSGVYVVAGDSGHGFKMMPIAGAWIKDLLESGEQKTARWRWKEGQDASGNVSWRTGHVTDLKDVSKAREDLVSKL